MSKKGRQYEFWVREVIAASLGLDKEDLMIGSASESGADVYPRKEIQKKFPFAIEAKNQKTIKLKEYWLQAEKNAREGLCPAVCFRAPGITKEAKNLVIIDMETFLALIASKREHADVELTARSIETPKLSEARLR